MTHHPLSIPLFTLLYVISDLLLPLYNKTLFSNLTVDTDKHDSFHYPTMITLTQLGGISLIIVSLWIVFKLCRLIVLDWIGTWLIMIGKKYGISWVEQLETKFGLHRASHHNAVGLDGRRCYALHEDSYDDLDLLLNEDRIPPIKMFFMKVKELALVSVAFAAVITLSNLGLDKVSLNVHVLLRTTTIFWIVILSFCLKNERPTFLQIFFTLFVVCGACLLSMDAVLEHWKLKSSNIPGIAINLISAFCSGVMGVSLRSACLKVQKPPFNMSIMEITAFKLSMASILMTIPALILDVAIARPTFFEAFFSMFTLMAPLLLGGIVVTALYQSAVVALTSRTRALSVGVVHQLMLLPQLLMFTLLDLTHILPQGWKVKVFRYSVPELIGAGLILVGVFGYAMYRWHHDWKESRDREIDKITRSDNG
mmetsp:Transcript_253/g.825  ORF Transcript_253/g.825 Transcript_253/m.825 type:complete len:424 (-) Transcript_253:1609-2880(-)